MMAAKLPKRSYSLSEELISSVSHGVGAVIGLVELVVGVWFAALSGNLWAVVAMSIYGFSLVLLFLMSTLYHALTPKRAKAVFRIFDHVSIFVLIAGSYTPYTLVLIREHNPVLGWAVFIIIWVMAILGIIFIAISIERFKVSSMIAYLGMGWMIVFAMSTLVQLLSPLGLALLIGGGVVYTAGVIFYAIGSKKKYFHSIWHFFVLGGSLLHYFSILFDVILPTLHG